MKVWYDKTDISRRYDVGTSVAEAMIRCIKSYCGGGRASKGRVLAAELYMWENYIKPDGYTFPLWKFCDENGMLDRDLLAAATHLFEVSGLHGAVIGDRGTI